MKLAILFFSGFLLLLNSCSSKKCDIERISSNDKTWLIPFEYFAAIGFTSDKNHRTVLRSTTKLRDFSDCDGWFGKGHKQEFIEAEFDKDSCNSPRCNMRMTISRNSENKGSKIHLELFDFSHLLAPQQEKKKTDQKLYVPGLKREVNTWIFPNNKKSAEVVSVNYSKEYGIVAYKTDKGEFFVMDSVFARPYSPM